MAFSCLHSLISLLVILTYQATAQYTPFIPKCDSGRDNYTANSTYQNNLNTLLINLSSNTNIDYGFYNFSYGKSSDTVHAIGLCRGDVKPQECRSCLNDSRVQLTSQCPYQKEGIGFTLTCMLRYSNKPIYGIMDDSEVFFQWTGSNATMVEKFNGVLMSLLKGLGSKAASGDSLRKFATGNGTGPNSQSIYALVQCTPDLSEQYCNDCLQGAISRIQICCSGHRNVRIARRSCNVRFDENRFYAAIADTPPLPHAPSADSTPKKGAQGKSNTSRYVIIITVGSAVALVLLVIFIRLYLRMKNPRKRSESEIEEDDEIEVKESLQFDFDTIRVATNDFSDANKLGEGGFGPVYKGMLSDGQEIAVKRLSRASSQGDIEFKNEVILLAKLQHRNLVRLLGFCLERRERLLVYEFLPNKSLNYFIFDPTRNTNLNWEKRYKIIQGIARGLLYLHEDSRLRIIHRDLKLSNILLDQEMNSKISDFGTARLFLEDQTRSHTNRIVGTYRYMAPEYAMDGHFSLKSDVFSFGVMILEIISGRRNTDDLLSFVWKNWSEGIIANIKDPSLNDGSRDEIRRCIHIGLLCVQEDIDNRPAMASVTLMFNSHSATLPVPLHPAFYMYSTSLSDRKPSESRSYSNEASVNKVSITELSPR